MIGIGSTLTYGTGSSEHALPKLTKIVPSEMVTGKIDDTTLEDDDFVKKCLPGMLDPGPLVGELEYSKDAWDRLIDLQVNRTIETWTVTPPEDDPEIEDTVFKGYVAKVTPPSFEPEVRAVIGFEIQPTGRNISYVD